MGWLRQRMPALHTMGGEPIEGAWRHWAPRSVLHPALHAAHHSLAPKAPDGIRGILQDSVEADHAEFGSPARQSLRRAAQLVRSHGNRRVIAKDR